MFCNGRIIQMSFLVLKKNVFVCLLDIMLERGLLKLSTSPPKVYQFLFYGSRDYFIGSIEFNMPDNTSVLESIFFGVNITTLASYNKALNPAWLIVTCVTKGSWVGLVYT